MTGSSGTEYPSQQEMEELDDSLLWIDEVFLRSDPAAFADANLPFFDIATLISRELDVDRNGIFCVGSGAVGLSINPTKVKDFALKEFDLESDLDIAVISARHFEQAWQDLREATQPHLVELPVKLVENLSWQRKRFFDGVILTTELLPFLSFAGRWLGAIERVAEQIVRSLDRNVDVHLWLYRDYWSLRNYVFNSLVQSMKMLEGS